MGILWSTCTLNNVNFAIQVAWCVFLLSGKVRMGDIFRNKNVYLKGTCPSPDIKICYFFLNRWKLVKLGLDSDNFLARELEVKI